MYKDEEIEKFIESLDIVQVIGEYVTLKKSGANYKGLSPFKEERTPSFTVSPVKNIFKDFSTGIGGNVISFYMRINNLSFYEAVEELSAKYNVPIRKLQQGKERSSENERYYTVMKKAYEIFKENIFKSKEALEYMETRGYSQEDIKKFGLGFAFDSWNGLMDRLLADGCKQEEMLELGLIRRNDNGNVFDYFRNRIMFPIYNEGMKIVGFGGRTVSHDENTPKYLNSPDSRIFRKGKELFGLFNRGESIRKKGLAILMEGYLDVLTAHKNNFQNSVASLGTAFTEDQARLLKKYTDNVIIAYDNDSAGKDAVMKAGYILKKQDFNIRCLAIDDEVKDPDEYLRRHGRRQFLEVLKTSKGIFEFLFDSFSETLNLNEVMGKRKIIEKFREFFSNIVNNTEKNLYINKLSIELGIEKSVLEEELGSFIRTKGVRKKGKARLEEKVATKRKGSEVYNHLEKETLKFLLKYCNSHDSRTAVHYRNLESKKFENVIYRDIFEKMKEIGFDMERVGSLMLEEEEQELVTTLKLEAEWDVLKEEGYYKDIFIGWFLREIEHVRNATAKKDKEYVKLQHLKSELKIIHNINEIEEMYKEFNLIRRSDHV